MIFRHYCVVEINRVEGKLEFKPFGVLSDIFYQADSKLEFDPRIAVVY
jgi:hypothetical protein